MMRDQRARKFRRLLIWFCLNFIIFIACYLNYRLALKHRYLYKTLNVGLCFSRAAAMVINFNLLLVWLPMCKYSLTRLACFATNLLRHQKELHQESLAASAVSTVSLLLDNNNINAKFQNQGHLRQQESRGKEACYKSTGFDGTIRKVKASIGKACGRINRFFLNVKINSVNSFLIAVDHCKSLHTICATTITIASVVHTAAHIMNVINFSKNFDPLLSNLNMAEHRGQNPLHLLLSVPGITGSLMIIILILMSLSSVDIIRNSSYDLFQVFHRLSVIFVILLFLHPSSHVLKEQSNVGRHHPELCYAKMALTASPMASPAFNKSLDGRNLNNSSSVARVEFEKTLLTPSGGAQISPPNEIINFHLLSNQQGNKITIQGQEHSRRQNSTTINRHKRNQTPGKLDDTSTSFESARESAFAGEASEFAAREMTKAVSSMINNTQSATDDSLCPDRQPLFVAQSSICWYVLSLGLSCYLLDLLLRRLRRSKSAIRLIDARSDSEGNLIELTLSSNHKRFAQWLPGQFIYLNCPQIATFEWHPFTISSMDNKSRRFTLHIKTGGDWTRKLRKKLESSGLSSNTSLSSSLSSTLNLLEGGKQKQIGFGVKGENLHANILIASKLHLDCPALADFEGYSKSGQPQIECTKVAQFRAESDLWPTTNLTQVKTEESVRIEFDQGERTLQLKHPGQCKLLSELYNSSGFTGIRADLNLELFVDGPFHSPFERLLEQQVSVCIASGVGWTAFSSVFQCLTNSHLAWPDESRDCWWSKWKNFAINAPRRRPLTSASCKPGGINDSSDNNNNSIQNYEIPSKIRKPSNTKLHLMIIVTSIEQLKPFYKLALNYLHHIHNECQIKVSDQLNPVREITAFITRSTKEDEAVREFCRQENILMTDQESAIRVNNMFDIQFGKPKFDLYLSAFNTIYSGQKISVYCCGSYQVKKSVREICRNLNKGVNNDQNKIVYSYHEESF